MEQRQHLKHAKQSRILHCRLRNNSDELPPLAEAVENFGNLAGWDSTIVMQINLVLEELIVNAIDYGYADGRCGSIEVMIETNPNEIRMTIEDDGAAFDPFIQPPPDLSLALEDRPIGGLGIHLVRSYMDSYSYVYCSGRNRVTLSKRLRPQDQA